MTDRFALFELPDGRVAYVRPDAVNVVYDHEQSIVNNPVAVVATSTVNMVVPYTATRVLEILRG